MLRVLVCDDEEVIVYGIKKMINRCQLNLEVMFTTTSSIEALQIIEEEKPEIVVLDINMPKMDGLETIKRIREFSKTVIIIIVSGYNKFDYAQQAIAMGVFHYLLKPLDFNIFKDVLEKAIRAHIEQITPALNEVNKTVDLIDYIKEHFYENDLSLHKLSQLFFLSPSTLTKIIKNRTTLTFTDYLNHLRILYAQELLLDKKNYSMQDISLQCGYSSQHYFSRIFKEYTSLSPIQYRLQHQKVIIIQ